MTRWIPTYSSFASGVLIFALIAGMFAHGYAQIRPTDPDASITLVVICGGDGAQTVLLDQDGDPVDPEQCLRELCSACLTTPFTVTDGSPPLPSRSPAWQPVAFFTPVAIPPTYRHSSDPRPRGPPFIA